MNQGRKAMLEIFKYTRVKLKKKQRKRKKTRYDLEGDDNRELKTVRSFFLLIRFDHANSSLVITKLITKVVIVYSA